MKKRIDVREILEFLDSTCTEYEYIKKRDCVIIGFASLNKYKAGCLTWIKPGTVMHNKDSNTITLAVASERYPGVENTIICDNPKKVFFDIVERFWEERQPRPAVGVGTIIGDEVKIGTNTVIGCNCVIDGDVTIGDNCVLDHNITITGRVSVGNNTVIQSGCIIGYDGFSYAEDENGNKKMIPHHGGVHIGNDVFLGPNCLVDRGMIDDTYISEGCRIDGLCHISHNAVLGKGTVLISGTRIFGSVETGSNAYISSAIVNNQTRIGENSTIGVGTVVMRDIESDTIVFDKPDKIFKKKQR